MKTLNKKLIIIKTLIFCGILSPLLLIGTDLLAALNWDGYNYTSQSASELSAIGSPTRPFVVPLLITTALLMIAFSLTILRLADKKRTLRITGILLVIFGVVCLTSLLFPMNLRGAEQSFTGMMHLIFTGVNVILIILFIGFGAAVHGKGFRIYSIMTILITLAFGAWAGMQASQVEAGLPTPLLGLIERVSYYLPYLWVLVFAVILLRAGITKSQLSLREEKYGISAY